MAKEIKISSLGQTLQIVTSYIHHIYLFTKIQTSVSYNFRKLSEVH